MSATSTSAETPPLVLRGLAFNLEEIWN